MRNHPQFFRVAVVTCLVVAGCAGGAGGRTIYDTRDLVVEAAVPDAGFWYVAEGTAAEDAVDDVMLEMGPIFAGDTPPSATIGLAPMLVPHTWPLDQEQVELDYRVTSFDTAENAEVRCSVYLDGELVVEDVAVGPSPVAECGGEFTVSDFR